MRLDGIHYANQIARILDIGGKEVKAGTRTIHAFGGYRADRVQSYLMITTTGLNHLLTGLNSFKVPITGNRESSS